MDIYILLFMFIVLIGVVMTYAYYLKEKKQELQAIREGMCPKCESKDIITTDQRSGGCSGTKIISFECACGYTNSFAIDGQSSCGL